MSSQYRAAQPGQKGITRSNRTDRLYLRRFAYPCLSPTHRHCIARNNAPIDAKSFGEEMYWEHTQLLDILVSEQDNLSQIFYVNIPNRGMINNLPYDVVVEVPARVDRAGIHPFALGDLPQAVIPTLMPKVSSLDLIIEAVMKGSRHKALQAMINDPHFADISVAKRVVNELIIS